MHILQDYILVCYEQFFKLFFDLKYQLPTSINFNFSLLFELKDIKISSETPPGVLVGHSNTLVALQTFLNVTKPIFGFLGVLFACLQATNESKNANISMREEILRSLKIPVIPQQDGKEDEGEGGEKPLSADDAGGIFEALCTCNVAGILATLLSMIVERSEEISASDVGTIFKFVCRMFTRMMRCCCYSCLKHKKSLEVENGIEITSCYDDFSDKGFSAEAPPTKNALLFSAGPVDVEQKYNQKHRESQEEQNNQGKAEEYPDLDAQKRNVNCDGQRLQLLQQQANGAECETIDTKTAGTLI